MMVDKQNHKEKLFLKCFRTAFLILSFIIVVSCQTTSKQYTASSATYISLPVYNERTHNRFAFSSLESERFDKKDFKNTQILALPPQKPKQIYLNATDIRNDPDIMIGYSVEILEEYFGAASTKRKDGASTIYQYYVSPDCIMDVFAYNEALDVVLGQEDVSSVYYVDEDVRQKSVIEYTDLRTDEANKKSCMSAILAKQATQI